LEPILCQNWKNLQSRYIPDRILAS
jgi:hypothetical protein